MIRNKKFRSCSEKSEVTLTKASSWRKSTFNFATQAGCLNYVQPKLGRSKKLFFLIFPLLVFACQTNTTENANSLEPEEKYSIQSPLGKKFTPALPSEKMLEKYKKAKADFEKDSNNIDHIIWYGRRTAYLGRYADAIQIYTDGIKQFPKDARLYRHRGHRYISIREYDKAIQDFEKAVQLIEGKENEIEPDGLPNAQNIPVSTLHGNIWYHLGLAHYLKHDFEKAFDAYTQCRNTGSNGDNIVSSTHWLYMIQRRLGNEEMANAQLTPIHNDMNIIENHSYYQLCKFYKGLIPRDSLMNGDGTPSGDAVRYGIANWDIYNDNQEAAKRELERILESKAWTSFGYLAAEQDMLKYFK